MNGFGYLLLGLLCVAVIALGVSLWQRRRALAAEAHAQALAALAVAAQRDAESALAAADAQRNALGEAALDALLILDAQRQVIWGNRAAWEMFNAGAPAIGHAFIGLMRDYELNQAVMDATSGNRPIVRQAAVNGRTLRIRAAPVETVGGIAVVIQDVSELQRLGRARRDFVANISHELRTPLANIDLAAQTLRDGGSKDHALAQRLLDQISQQVQTLSQLSQEILDLSQIESGQALLKLVPSSLIAVVDQVVRHLTPQADLKQQHISLFVPDSLVVLMDEHQVRRVLGNLLHNAIKFSPEGGIISIYAEPTDDEDVRICVADTGPGIPDAEKLRVFERFYKQDRARSKGGTGLGLAIARHIVEGHGGRIWVESRPGEGARFYFTLPKA